MSIKLLSLFQLICLKSLCLSSTDSTTALASPTSEPLTSSKTRIKSSLVLQPCYCYDNPKAMAVSVTDSELAHPLDFIGCGRLDADVLILGMEGSGGGEAIIRTYQVEKLGRYDGDTLPTELMPIPKPKLHQSGYDDLIPQFTSRDEYYKAVKPRRFNCYGD